jgi:negative elongation factor E
VMALKAPKPEPEKPTLRRGSSGGAQARDARELARKLLKSGAIRAIASPKPKHDQQSFKRPRAGRERKLSGPGSLDKVVSSYQPFSSIQDPPGEKSPPKTNSLYDSIVTARAKLVSFKIPLIFIFII